MCVYVSIFYIFYFSSVYFIYSNQKNFLVTYTNPATM